MGDLRKNNHTNAKVTAGNDLSFLFDDDNSDDFDDIVYLRIC